MAMKAAYLTTDFQRMWDLVRQQRGELLDAGLITLDEYAVLAAAEAHEIGPGRGSPAPRRLESYDEVGGQLVELRTALDESVKLQSHYATLLNPLDGGERKQFADGKAWIARLRETGTLPPRKG